MAESEELRADTSGDPDHPPRPPEPLVAQFLCFLRENALWWIMPIVILLALMIVVSLLAGHAELPFIYR